MITIDEALQLLFEQAKPITESETISLMEARHRVLSQAQKALVDVPNADASAMDGYAIRGEDLQAQTEFVISQRIPAGHPPQALQPKTAARIFTGSEIPPGADTVVIQENCVAEGDKVKIIQPPAIGANVRRRGQDIKCQTEMFAPGHLLLPQDLGMLASVGIATIPVIRKIKVAILSTGDELVEPGSVLGPGKIFNSNRFALKGLLDSINADVIDCGNIGDDLQGTEEALRKASELADVVITTGGVSVGEEDHVKDAVSNLGQLNLWKLKIKPGKPLAFGQLQCSNKTAAFFGLPGNPVAVFVTFLILVRPFLLLCQGRSQASAKLETQRLPTNFSITSTHSRQEYIRVRIDNGKLSLFRSQDSGVLSSTSWANALAVIPADTIVNDGDLLETISYDQFGL